MSLQVPDGNLSKSFADTWEEASIATFARRAIPWSTNGPNTRTNNLRTARKSMDETNVKKTRNSSVIFVDRPPRIRKLRKRDNFLRSSIRSESQIKARSRLFLRSVLATADKAGFDLSILYSASSKIRFGFFIETLSSLTISLTASKARDRDASFGEVPIEASKMLRNMTNARITEATRIIGVWPF